MLGFDCTRWAAIRIAQIPSSAAPTPQAPQPMQSTVGLEKILASKIAAALQPFQEQFQKMQSAIVHLQEDTQCRYSGMDFSDMEDAVENMNPPAAPAANVPKQPKLSKASKLSSKVAK